MIIEMPNCGIKNLGHILGHPCRGEDKEKVAIIQGNISVNTSVECDQVRPPLRHLLNSEQGERIRYLKPDCILCYTTPVPTHHSHTRVF